MNILLIGVFMFFAFIIFWAMVGYPLSVRVIAKYLGKPELVKIGSYEPTVTIMIVAHNEEKVIHDKLINLTKVNYPQNKLDILVSSDNSTDKTNEIVNKFIQSYPDFQIRLYKVKERKGKTNAQNEAAETVESEILIMTDANAMLDPNAVKELVSSLSVQDVAYVTGRLKYINNEEEWTSESESSYWEFDLKMREAESKLHSVTAGNGALYACKTNEYHHFEPLRSHDSAMPKHYVILGKRAIYNKDAIAYERAGAVVEDEFGRKVRMARNILASILPNMEILNVFKYKWFSYCFFGHRYCRNNLWLAHIGLFLLNIPLSSLNLLFKVFLALQILFYFIAYVKHITKIDHKIMNLIYYYCLTITAQIIGAYRQSTGKSKPFWEKAETTR